MDIHKIMSMLPHRPPFLLVDKIIDLTDKQIVGIKNVTFNEFFFQGHFPGRPIMPGVLQIEALAQAAAILAIETLELAGSGKLVYFMAIEEAKFRNPVEPGVLLTLGRLDQLQASGQVDCLLASGARLPFASYVRPGVECELAVHLARDLPAGPCTREQAAAVGVSATPALQLPLTHGADVVVTDLADLMERDAEILAGLDTTDATFSCHDLLQQFKTHPFVRDLLEGGKRVRPLLAFAAGEVSGAIGRLPQRRPPT